MPFQETWTVPGKEISALNGPVFFIFPFIVMSIEVGEGLTIFYEGV